MEDDQIIVDVQMDALIASLQELRQQYEANTEALKKLDKESDDYDKQVIELTQQNKVLQQEMRGVEKQIQNEIKAQKSQEDSLVQLRAKLANLNKQYDSMSGMERMGDAGVELQKKIKSLHDQILGLEGDTGRMQRNVGNYPEAIKPVTAQIKELTQQLIAMKMEGKENTKEYTELLATVGQMKDKMMDAQREVKQMASDTGTLNTVMDAAKLTTGAFSAALGIFNLIGDKDSKTAQELAEAQRKLQAAIAITTGLQAVQNTLQKESALMMGIHKLQIWAAAKAQDEYTAATGRATIAQRLFNSVAKANPYVLLAAAILSVVGALAAFSTGTKEAKEQTAELNDKLKEQYEMLGKLVTYYDTVTDKMLRYYQEGIEQMRLEGKALDDIRAQEDKMFDYEDKRLQRLERGFASEIANIKNMAKSIDQKTVELHDLQIEYDYELRRGNVEFAASLKQRYDNLKAELDRERDLYNQTADIINRRADLDNRRREAEQRRIKEDADRERAAAEEQRRRHEERLQRMKEEREALRKQTKELDKYFARLKTVSSFDLSTRQAQAELDAELDAFRKKWEETQKALEAYERELKIWQDAFPKDWNDEMMDKLERQSNPLYNFSQAYKENAEAIMETSSALESSFSSVASMYETMAKDESKSEEERAEAARKAKAWAKVQIAANAGTAMAKGIASAVDVGFPAAIPAMATMVAAVLAAIAQAKALAAESHEHGGVIGGKFIGATRGHDDVLMMGKRGELVLNADQQKTLYDIANGNVSTNLAAELAAAIRQMPAPVVEYTELQRFGDNVAILNESQKLK